MTVTAHFTKGDIILGHYRGGGQAVHPIIYFREVDSDLFLGGMLTHSTNFGNIRLEDDHFEVRIDNDPRPSYFVKNFLLKRQEWGEFTRVGRLSRDGLAFVLSRLEGTTPQIWENYK